MELSPEVMLARAALEALGTHEGQKDLSGAPVESHVYRVALSLAPDMEAMTVGFLHDVVEDSDLTVEDIAVGFTERITAAVDAITRRDGETYWEYIDRVVKNPLAVRVKLADLADNLADNRQNFPGAKDLYRQHDIAYRLLKVVKDEFEKRHNLSPGGGDEEFYGDGGEVTGTA